MAEFRGGSVMGKGIVPGNGRISWQGERKKQTKHPNTCFSLAPLDGLGLGSDLPKC